MLVFLLHQLLNYFLLFFLLRSFHRVLLLLLFILSSFLSDIKKQIASILILGKQKPAKRVIACCFKHLI